MYHLRNNKEFKNVMKETYVYISLIDCIKFRVNCISLIVGGSAAIRDNRDYYKKKTTL